MARKGLNGNGGWKKDRTVIITRWKMSRDSGTGFSDPDIIRLIKSPNGLYMGFLHDTNGSWDRLWFVGHEPRRHEPWRRQLLLLYASLWLVKTPTMATHGLYMDFLRDNTILPVVRVSRTATLKP